MKSLALLMIGITLVFAEKYSVQYFNMEATGLPNFSQFVMAGHEQNIMNNSSVAKHRFTQTDGVQVWDDQTGTTDAFRQEGSVGEDSLSLDLKEKELKEKELKDKELKELKEKELKEKELKDKELKEMEKELEKLLKELREREDLYFSPVCSPSRRRT